MTVTSTDSRVIQLCNGVSREFPVNFYFLNETHLLVTLVAPDLSTSTLTLDSNYSVSGAGDEDGGSITTTVAYANGYQIIVDRDVPATQETEYQQNDAFPAKTTEKAFDKLTMIAQSVLTALSSSLRFPLGEFNLSGILPAAGARKLRALVFDSNGSPGVSAEPYREPSSIAADAVNAANNIVSGITTPTFQSYVPTVLLDGTDYVSGTSTQVPLPPTVAGKTIAGVFFDGTYQGRTQYTLSPDGTILAFSTPIPLGVTEIDVMYFSPSLMGSFQQTGYGTVPRSFQSKLSDSVSILDFVPEGSKAAFLSAAIDASVFLNKALATGRIIHCPKGDYRLDSTVTPVGGGGITGDGERTFFQRNFSGGPLIGYPGGEPIYLSNFQIACSPSVTVANGDSGIDIGYSIPWAGRGLVANLLISGQWDGFKWKAGTGGSISNVQCIANQGTGFYGINPRMEFYDCLSQQNAGNGYHLYTEAGGESGVCFTRCGTFGNQGYGHLADAAVGFNAANLNWVSCTSSFDGQGGFFVASPTLQIAMTQILSEYSGYASNFNPAFSTNLAAVGIQINHGTYISGSDIQALNCAGAGILLDSCTSGSLGQVVTNGNGTGLRGGSNQCGFLFNNNNVDITLSGLISNTGGQQTTDLSFGAGNQVNLILPLFRTYSNSGASLVQFVGSKTTATRTIPSSNTLQLLDYCDVQTVIGTININSISADTWPGRKVTLIFQGNLTVSNTGNIKLLSPFAATPNSTLTLTTDGTNWYGK